MSRCDIRHITAYKLRPLLLHHVPRAPPQIGHFRGKLYLKDNYYNTYFALLLFFVLTTLAVAMFSQS